MKIREFLKGVLFGVISAILMYLIFAFANSDLNIKNWTNVTKGFCSIMMLSSLLFGFSLNGD